MVAAVVLVVIAAAAELALPRDNHRVLSDAEQINVTLGSYEQSIANSDGTTACSLMTPLAQARTMVVGQHVKGLGTSCQEILSSVGQLEAKLLDRGLRSRANADAVLQASVGPLRFDPHHLIADASPFGRLIVFWHEDGRWLVGSGYDAMFDLTTPITKTRPLPAISPVQARLISTLNAWCPAVHMRNAPAMAALAASLESHAPPPINLTAELRQELAVSTKADARLARVRVPPDETAGLRAYVAYLRAGDAITARSVSISARGRRTDAVAYLKRASAGYHSPLPAAVEAHRIC